MGIMPELETDLMIGLALVTGISLLACAELFRRLLRLA
jgi:hypothetical protein